MNLKGMLGALIAAQIGKAMTGRSGAGGGLGGTLSRTLGSSAGTAAAGALAGMIFGSKKGRSMGGSIGKLGGLAAIGTLAWQAYQDWQAKQTQAPHPAGAPSQPGRRASFLEAGSSPFGQANAEAPPPGSALAPRSEGEEEELSRILIRAMIAAAKADGHIDERERAAIGGELEKLPLGEADRTFIETELEAPVDVGRVAGHVSDPQVASAIYAASLLAITVDSDVERRYLAALAERLGLEPGLVRSLHAKLEEVAPAA